jgi:hypothetical protein
MGTIIITKMYHFTFTLQIYSLLSNSLTPLTLDKPPLIIYATIIELMIISIIVSEYVDEIAYNAIRVIIKVIKNVIHLLRLCFLII